MNANRAMPITTPDTLRAQLLGRGITALLDACTTLDADVTQLANPVTAAILALRSLAKPTRQLRRDANELKKHLPERTTFWLRWCVPARSSTKGNYASGPPTSQPSVPGLFEPESAESEVAWNALIHRN